MGCGMPILFTSMYDKYGNDVELEVDYSVAMYERLKPELIEVDEMIVFDPNGNDITQDLDDDFMSELSIQCVDHYLDNEFSERWSFE